MDSTPTDERLLELNVLLGLYLSDNNVIKMATCGRWSYADRGELKQMTWTGETASVVL